MKSEIDLHVHSSCSDGTLTPEQVVVYAFKKGLSAVALTDHDTIAGIAPAKAAAARLPLELIPGIEFSTVYGGRDVHILGLAIPWEEPAFVKALEQFLDSRDIRNEKLIAALCSHGIDISRAAMQEAFPDSVWTRAHFGRFLLERGYVRSISEAFLRYLGDDACCFIPREKVSPLQAVDLISQSGGFAVLAHPLLCHLSSSALKTLVLELKEAGLCAIEAIYSANRPGDESALKHLALSCGLKITGGSDYHGDNKPDIEIGCGRGDLVIPYQIWNDLQNG